MAHPQFGSLPEPPADPGIWTSVAWSPQSSAAAPRPTPRTGCLGLPLWRAQLGAGKHERAGEGCWPCPGTLCFPTSWGAQGKSFLAWRAGSPSRGGAGLDLVCLSSPGLLGWGCAGPGQKAVHRGRLGALRRHPHSWRSCRAFEKLPLAPRTSEEPPEGESPSPGLGRAGCQCGDWEAGAHSGYTVSRKLGTFRRCGHWAEVKS